MARTISCIVVLVAVLAVAVVVAGSNGKPKQHPQCSLQPPYLYVTFHGSSASKNKPDIYNNAFRYTLEGCELGSVLVSGPIFEPRGTWHQPRAHRPDFPSRSLSLAGMVLDNAGVLYLANADKTGSAISQWSSCKTADSSRTYLGDFVVEAANNTGLQHPYGLAFNNAKTRLFASAQNSNVVLAYEYPSGRPVASPPGLSGKSKYPGTFVNVGNTPRGIAFDHLDNLYVANHVDAVLVYNTTGYLVNSIAVDSPIGVYFDPVARIMYMGSNAKKSAIYTYDVRARTIGPKYKESSLSHPAGMLVHKDLLYVVSQDPTALHTFNTTSGAYNGVIATFDDLPEQLILSPC